MKLRTAFFLVSFLWFLFPCKSSSVNGYKALINWEDGFLAAGSGGRIDCISSTGVLSKSVVFPDMEFNCLLSYNDLVFVAGKSGILMISMDKNSFKSVESGTDKNIFSLASINGKIVAGSEQGELLIADDKGLFKSVKLNLKGNIVSLSARESDCFGASDQGEIIHSTDGTTWSLMDFNEYYSGYYKPCSFTKILAMDNQIAVAGKHDDGSPALFFSTQGTVWSERTLNYTDEKGMLSYLTELPSELFYDSAKSQLLLVCSEGRLMKIPSCSHCNKLSVCPTYDIKCISQNRNTWLVVGENFSIKVLDADLNF